MESNLSNNPLSRPTHLILIQKPVHRSNKKNDLRLSSFFKQKSRSGIPDRDFFMESN